MKKKKNKFFYFMEIFLGLCVGFTDIFKITVVVIVLYVLNSKSEASFLVNTVLLIGGMYWALDKWIKPFERWIEND